MSSSAMQEQATPSFPGRGGQKSRDRTRSRQAPFPQYQEPCPNRPRISQSLSHQHLPQLTSSSLDSAQDLKSERPSASTLRSAFRTGSESAGTSHTLTPDSATSRATGSSALSLGSAAVSPRLVPRDAGSSPHHMASLRIAHGPSGGRRQGMVFGESFGRSCDNFEFSTAPTTPTSPHRQQHQSSHGRSQQRGASVTMRPRTRTLDGTMLKQRATPPPGSDKPSHNRVGSLGSSSGAPTKLEEPQRSCYRELTGGASNTLPKRTLGPHTINVDDANYRVSSWLPTSRPSSPSLNGVVSVDSLPVPMPTRDPETIISLMQTLNGRMHGEVEFQTDTGGDWINGYAYIDDDNCSLLWESAPENGADPFPQLIPDLRGCRVLLGEHPKSCKACFELVFTVQHAAHVGETSILLLRPMASDEWDHWLAALLTWQQTRQAPSKSIGGGGAVAGVAVCGSSSSSPVVPSRPHLRRQAQSAVSENGRGSNIIKVGTVKLWNKDPPMTPPEIFRRLSTEKPRRGEDTSWTRVSCILHEDGEFRLLMENDISALAVIQLSQLSRCAIQQLDCTVLEEEFCIAIFPMYAPSATHMSIYRPVYLALDSRVAFEVWFVLFRAFAVPEIYRLGGADNASIEEVEELDQEGAGELFRVYKTIVVRLTEAKITGQPPLAVEPVRTSLVEKGTPKPDPDRSIGNYWAELMLNGEVRARTTTKSDTNNPYWREECDFTDVPQSVKKLLIVIKRLEGLPPVQTPKATGKKAPSSPPSPKFLPKEVVCGTVSIMLDEFKRDEDREEWFQILDDKAQPIGSMLVKISYAEHVALLSKEYDAFSDLLHRFSTKLTTLISAALPGQLRRLSETFVNIFQASGTASDWLMALIDDEIDGIGSQSSFNKLRFSGRLKSAESFESSSTTATARELLVRDMTRSLAGEANLLFRGNTLLTLSLEFHMRRLGAEYLQEVLRDKIVQLDKMDVDCEVDPSRLPHLGHSSHHQHQFSAELDQRWSWLLLQTTEIWRCISESADRLPAELRHILKFVRAVAEDRYGDFVRAPTYTAVSGFLFLRFLCPAILSPKLFGLLRDHPRPLTQRSLTLIAKVLQKMANQSTFGKREQWMEPMNKFLAAQRFVFRDFIDKVCEIPGSDSSLIKSVPASYSTPATMVGRLGLMAREGFPSLPYLIDQTHSFAVLVKLWTVAHPQEIMAGTDDADVELASFDAMCRKLQRRTDACLEKMDRGRAEAVSKASSKHVEEEHHDDDDDEDNDNEDETQPVFVLDEPYEQQQKQEQQAPDDDKLPPPPPPPQQTRQVGQVPMSDDDDGPSSSLPRHNEEGKKSGTMRARNGKVGRTILNGIMRIGGRSESPDAKHR
ncbi:hypothetical protein CDD82_791 [Ophiocordyceps australis]|uniref:Ras-GAP domain-containing protein n=1 Tax=Ophiocordyceps australis TaxID=1399860 RepID=A0A2C5ZPU2_9HYPO|nr:hypothetical protein CDD82_791 [Ophiocordyceps australis]